MRKRWQHRPDGANWGDFGPDDQLGRLNLLTPEVRLRAAREIVTGACFSLSLPLDFPGGNALNERRLPPVLEPTKLGGVPFYNRCLCEFHANFQDVISDDVLTIHTQYSTQWDALSHVGCLFDADGDGELTPTYYNGFRAGIDVKAPSDRRELGDSVLGIDVMAKNGIQGRGVLVDLERHFAREYVHVGYDALMRVLEADGIEIESGDLLCLRTGYADMLLEANKSPSKAGLHAVCAGLDGRDQKLLEWITRSGIAAIAADNYAVEHILEVPELSDRSKIPLHQHCLFKLGLPLAELWYFTELASWLRVHGRSRFFLTAPPLHIPGGAGSPVSPIATV